MQVNLINNNQLEKNFSAYTYIYNYILQLTEEKGERENNIVENKIAQNLPYYYYYYRQNIIIFSLILYCLRFFFQLEKLYLCNTKLETNWYDKI